MTTQQRRITIEMVMAATGLGPRTARRWVREGKLPGRMEGTHYVCPPGEYDRWYAGEWTPRPTETAQPVELRHHRKAS